jgi:acyl-CoA synthetase (AMP-forming)/AMP-acid ligase II
MSDLVEAVLASCDRWGENRGLSSAPRSGSRIETAGGAARGLSSAPRSGSRIETLTYADLGTRIRATSAGLTALGMEPGDRVLFSVRPGPDAVVLALGIVHAGGCVVFADPGAGEALFRALTALAAPRWVAAESLLYLASTPLLRPLARRRGVDLPDYARIVPDARHLYAGAWLPGVPRAATALRGLSSAPRSGPRIETPVTGHPGDGFEAAAQPGVLPPAAGAPQPARGGDEALIVFTSGTTEAPRAVVHTRASLGAGLGDIAAAAMRPGQRVLTDQLMVGIPALIAGAHWTMPPPGLDPAARPEAYLPRLDDADVLFAAPAAMDAILRGLEGRNAPRLETVVLGGAPVLRPLLERIRSTFPEAAIRAVYGMTELLPVAIADGVEKLARSEAAGDWVGRLVPGVEARIDDGELVLDGPSRATYLGEPATPEVRTGDLARIDDDGLTLLGRKKDMFIRGTQNVYPGLYEPVIASLPGVREAVMTGVPDEIGDDRLVVLVVPEDAPRHPDASHPVARAVARALPGLLDAGVLPDAVVAVPDLPRSGRNRKLDRAAVAVLARELL